MGNIESKNQKYDLGITVQRRQPGSLLAKINIAPPLKYGEKLSYTIFDYLPIGLYAIGLEKEELDNRESEYDYFGWHVNRPTRKLRLQVHFPLGKEPQIYKGLVKYAASAGYPSDREQFEEEKRLKNLVLERNGDRQVMTLEIDYPLSGLVYILSWKPIVKNG